METKMRFPLFGIMRNVISLVNPFIRNVPKWLDFKLCLTILGRYALAHLFPMHLFSTP